MLVDEAGRQVISLVGDMKSVKNCLFVWRTYSVPSQFHHVHRKPATPDSGIGCRRDVTLTQIEAAVMNVLNIHQLSIANFRMVATVDVKLQESIVGLVPPTTTAHEDPLSLLQHRPWVNKSSDFVRRRWEWLESAAMRTAGLKRRKTTSSKTAQWSNRGRCT